MCVDVYTPGVLLTPSNVMRIVREVEKWWSVSGRESLTEWLFIPKSKQKEIRRNYLDEIDQKKQAISYWINTDPLASWRRLITALDWVEEDQLADSIRPNAEPLTGKYRILPIHGHMYSLRNRNGIDIPIHLPMHVFHVGGYYNTCLLYTL